MNGIKLKSKKLLIHNIIVFSLLLLQLSCSSPKKKVITRFNKTEYLDTLTSVRCLSLFIKGYSFISSAILAHENNMRITRDPEYKKHFNTDQLELFLRTIEEFSASKAKNIGNAIDLLKVIPKKDYDNFVQVLAIALSESGVPSMRQCKMKLYPFATDCYSRYNRVDSPYALKNPSFLCMTRIDGEVSRKLKSQLGNDIVNLLNKYLIELKTKEI